MNTQRKPKNIAKALHDKDARAWNVELRPTEHDLVTCAALDRDHAMELARQLNACAWVTVQNAKADER